MAPNPSIGRTSDLAALGLHAAIYGQSPAPSEWPKFAFERTVVALAILANCSDHRFTGARMTIFGCTNHAACHLREHQFDGYFLRRRFFTRRAMAAGAWSGMAKTELTLISQST